jgi:hypothetical protein
MRAAWVAVSFDSEVRKRGTSCFGMLIVLSIGAVVAAR